MKHHKTIFVLLAAVCIALASLSMAEEKMPAPEGAEFWAYIAEKAPYTEWSFFPGYEGMHPGKSPHGAFLKVYVNEPALKAAKAGEPMPDGAIIVKENYAEDKETLMALTPMYKVEGYNPDAGDWFWAKYGPEGKVMKAGKVDGCINCHRVKKDNDWMFTGSK